MTVMPKPDLFAGERWLATDRIREPDEPAQEATIDQVQVYEQQLEQLRREGFQLVQSTRFVNHEDNTFRLMCRLRRTPPSLGRAVVDAINPNVIAEAGNASFLPHRSEDQ